jgi:hypothetical protein
MTLTFYIKLAFAILIAILLIAAIIRSYKSNSETGLGAGFLIVICSIALICLSYLLANEFPEFRAFVKWVMESMKE